MPETPSITIREVEGLRRSITLTERAKPYRGPSWPSIARHRLTWYVGNPEATLQVLGRELGPTTFEGTWKDRYLPGAVQAEGFEALDTCEALVAAFEALQLAGSLLEVTWGPQTRRGILAEFDPSYDRVEDVRWSATFVWRDAGRSAPRARAAERPTEQLRAVQIETFEIAAQEPANVEPSWSDRVFEGLRRGRDAVGGVFDALREARAVATVPAAAVGNAAASARNARAEIEELRADLVDLPAEYASFSDDVTDLVSLERYRRTLGRSTHDLEAEALRNAAALAAQRTPEPLAVVTLGAGASLARLALRWYGSADEWPRIAAASGLPPRSVLGADATVIVPALTAEVSR
jgi:hypothetical protein